MTAENRADLAHEAVFWAAVAEQAAARAKPARAGQEEQARAELARDGVAPTWRIPGLGTVPLAVTQPSVTVVDEQAYLAWVAERHPTEVEEVVRVRAAFDADLRRQLAAAECDPPCTPGGEVIPGLSFRPGGQPAGVSVRATSAAKATALAVARDVLDSLRPTAPPDGDR